jgi:hypothetical protein
MNDRRLILAAVAAVVVAVVAFTLAFTKDDGSDDEPAAAAQAAGGDAETSDDPGAGEGGNGSGGEGEGEGEGSSDGGEDPGSADGGSDGDSGDAQADGDPGDGETGAGGVPDGGVVRIGRSRGFPVGEVPPGAGAAADRRAVERVIRTYLLGIASGNGAQACAQLTAAGRRRKLREIARIAIGTEGTPCGSAILIYQGAYGDAINQPRIRNLKVNGNRARAVGPAAEVALLEKRDNVWLLSRYGH